MMISWINIKTRLKKKKNTRNRKSTFNIYFSCLLISQNLFQENIFFFSCRQLVLMKKKRIVKIIFLLYMFMESCFANKNHVKSTKFSATQKFSAILFTIFAKGSIKAFDRVLNMLLPFKEGIIDQELCSCKDLSLMES